MEARKRRSDLYDIVSLPFLVYLLVLGFSARDVTNISFLLTMFVFTFFFFFHGDMIICCQLRLQTIPEYVKECL